jgi:hypothetical protein
MHHRFSRREFLTAVGTVAAALTQTPAPDARVNRGTKVDLVHSLRPVVVPDLIGKSLDVAEKALRDNQLRVGAIDKETRQGIKPNTVLNEFPRSDSARGRWPIGLRHCRTPALASKTPPALMLALWIASTRKEHDLPRWSTGL